VHPLAVAAVVFVALGCLFWAFAAFAMVLSAVALVEITSRGRHGGTLLAAVGLISAVLVAAMAGYGRFAVPARVPQEPAAQQCQRNLRRIGAALRAFAKDHAGRYPDTLAELYPLYVSDESVLTCPAATQRGMGRHAYAFPGSGRRNPAPSDIVVHDRTIYNHNGRGGFVLRANGRVQWLNARAFERHILGMAEP